MVGTKSLYEASSACVRVGGTVGSCFKVNKGVKQVCEMDPLVFHIYIDGLVRERFTMECGRGVELIEWEQRE